jgi:hypothetical protein
LEEKKMATFVVNSAIIRPLQDPKACALGAPKALMQSGVKDVCFRTCYCCSEYGSVVFVIDGPNRNRVLEVFNQINIPVASIVEAE